MPRPANIPEGWSACGLRFYLRRPDKLGDVRPLPMKNNPKVHVGVKKMAGAKWAQSAILKALPCAGWRRPAGMMASGMMPLLRAV
ncbi:hypothetical protein [Xenorhabdus sp. IM139775]|uniref:hypothetical protein n=1 Tax=Xenorhabdus sp. IM139775 TaxID=3025876 RepID=UPI00235968F3|nr:hypothetical protein [Xenorhabdus sp. IM139775]MDC9595182.1 hypothetical protein [Xenorhabdus sp. IM139775]